MAARQVTVKDLRRRSQEEVPLEELEIHIEALLEREIEP
jgi:hypothetical protein